MPPIQALLNSARQLADFYYASHPIRVSCHSCILSYPSMPGMPFHLASLASARRVDLQMQSQSNVRRDFTI